MKNAAGANGICKSVKIVPAAAIASYLLEQTDDRFDFHKVCLIVQYIVFDNHFYLL